MATVTFDTLKFVNRLKASGLSEEQAQTIVEAQKGSLAEFRDSIGNKIRCK